jgi:serine phosphatase RsbU (regulator of sigma subunit)
MSAKIETRIQELMNELVIEREKNKNLDKEIEQIRIYFSEVEATNNHLIAATWREREIKRQLKEALEELNNTKQIVEKQNKRISESINYAQKIQFAINATETNLKEELPNSFIYYKPKDVISGDFPWYFKKGNDVFFAAVDCTGHGVPGAMLSIIGNLLLNNIVINHPQIKTSEILQRLHNQVVMTLKQKNPESFSSDGMDIALCKIDTINNKLYYSGAHRPLLFINKEGYSILKGDRFPIGGVQYKDQNKYTEQVLSYEKGDSVFIFSDGYPDQIGGQENRKFTTTQLLQLLTSLNEKEPNEIKTCLDRTYTKWMGLNKQIDDVLIIGVKF